MQLQDFLNKVRENESKRLKIIEIEVDGIGKVEFTRPLSKDLIKCMSETAGATKTIKTDEEVIKKTDIEAMLSTAKELVYNSCSLLQAEETREQFKTLHPYDIPVEIFGITKTIEIAAEIMEKFGGEKEIEKLEDDIKN